MEEHRWQLVGGHLALDLCNTVAWRRDPARTADRLTTPDRLADWYATATHGRKPTGTGDLRTVHRIREALTSVVRAQAGGNAIPGHNLETLAEAGRTATRRATLNTELPLSWTVDVRSLEDVTTALALSANEFLADAGAVHHLRECQGDGCGWFFLDSSRNHSRRWCDPEDCGNRARVRAYVARQRKNSQLDER